MAKPPDQIEAERGARREQADRDQVGGHEPREAPRSPSAAAADMTGNAVTAKAMPMSATGTLWKLRAKLTELMLPAAASRRPR